MPFASFPRPAAEGMRLCRSVRFRTAAMLLAAALLLADGEAERDRAPYDQKAAEERYAARYQADDLG